MSLGRRQQYQSNVETRFILVHNFLNQNVREIALKRNPHMVYNRNNVSMYYCGRTQYINGTTA